MSVHAAVAGDKWLQADTQYAPEHSDRCVRTLALVPERAEIDSSMPSDCTRRRLCDFCVMPCMDALLANRVHVYFRPERSACVLLSNSAKQTDCFQTRRCDDGERARAEDANLRLALGGRHTSCRARSVAPPEGLPQDLMRRHTACKYLNFFRVLRARVLMRQFRAQACSACLTSQQPWHFAAKDERAPAQTCAPRKKQNQKAWMMPGM